MALNINEKYMEFTFTSRAFEEGEDESY